MDSVDAIILNSVDELFNQPEIDMPAKKKEAPATEEVKGGKSKKADKAAAKTDTKAAAGKGEAKKKELPEGFGPREVPEGHTGLAALAEAAGRTAASARRILRGSDITKPEGQHGWFWKDGSKELKKVEALLAVKEEAEA